MDERELQETPRGQATEGAEGPAELQICGAVAGALNGVMPVC